MDNVHKIFWLLIAFVALTHTVDSVEFPVCDANSPTTKKFVVSWTGVFYVQLLLLQLSCLTILYTTCRLVGNTYLRRRSKFTCGQASSNKFQVHRTARGARNRTVCCCDCWPGLDYEISHPTDSEICGNQPA